ncbi:MAG: 4Fe-4S dicluster domain-containing protein [Pseudomonadota bacterium]
MEKGFIRIDQERCKGCGLCIETCPHGLIVLSASFNLKGYLPAEHRENETDSNRKCNGCALCAIICPDIAIEVYRE